jgi:hypothetical protein
MSVEDLRTIIEKLENMIILAKNSNCRESTQILNIFFKKYSNLCWEKEIGLKTDTDLLFNYSSDLKSNALQTKNEEECISIIDLITNKEI